MVLNYKNSLPYTHVLFCYCIGNKNLNLQKCSNLDISKLWIGLRPVWDPVTLFPGPKARGEGIEEGECHPGGEGECQPAEPAAGGLQQGEQLPEQPGAHQS